MERRAYTPARGLPAADSPRAGANPERFPALDLLRGAAMVLVVVAHAAAAYLSVRLPGLLWAVRERPGHWALDALFWGGVSAGMPLFFTISGFLAVKLHDDRGGAGFARDRWRRIVVPFLVSVVTILPLTYLVWGLGWLAAGRVGPRSLYRFKFLDPQIRAYFAGPAHLWFLEYLTLMLLAYGAYRWLRPDRDARVRPGPRWLVSPLAPFLVAGPTALLLFLGHRRFGLDPVMDMRNWFVPDPYRWAHHAWFFVVGTWLYTSRRDLDRLARFGPALGGLAALAFAVRFRLILGDLTRPTTGLGAVPLAVSGALFGWLAVYGGLGTAQRWCRRPVPAVRWLAERSYWVYLIHFPVVGLAQVALWPLAWSPWAKFPVVLGVTFFIGLATDRVLVRRSRLGTWLYGRTPIPAALSGPHRAERPVHA